MKNFTKLFAFGLMIFGFSNVSFAQDSETANASATVITPISISKDLDMNFGNVAVTSTGGTVILSPASDRQPTGGVTLPAFSAGTVAAAAFTVRGEADYTYSISLPNSVTITRALGSETMTVDAFTSTPTPTGKLSATGEQTVNVGATLHVAAGQVAGSYTSGDAFTVTVNYN